MPEMITAKEAYDRFHVTRKWLRERYAAGALRRTETRGRSATGEEYIKYLYPVKDIETELRIFSSRSQARRQAIQKRIDSLSGRQWN